MIYITNINAQETALMDNSFFIDTYNKTNELSNLIFNTFGKDLKKIEILKKTIESISSSTILTEKQKVDEMNKALQLPAEKSIEVYADGFKTNWLKLKEIYGQKLSNDYIQEQSDLLGKSGKYQIAKADNGCRRPGMYTLCSGAATTAAILCHAACVNTLFGMFVCFGLCATGQVYAIAVCYDAYCAGTSS